MIIYHGIWHRFYNIDELLQTLSPQTCEFCQMRSTVKMEGFYGLFQRLPVIDHLFLKKPVIGNKYQFIIQGFYPRIVPVYFYNVAFLAGFYLDIISHFDILACVKLESGKKIWSYVSQSQRRYQNRRSYGEQNRGSR